MRLTLDNRRTLFKRKVKESTQIISSFISTRIHVHIQASFLTTIMPHTDYANSPPPLRQPAPPASAMMPGRRQGSLISPAVSVAPGAFECWKRALSIGHKKSPDALASPRPAARTPVLTSRRHASRPPSRPRTRAPLSPPSPPDTKRRTNTAAEGIGKQRGGASAGGGHGRSGPEAAREHDSTTSDGPPSPPSPLAPSPSAFSPPSPRASAHGFCLVLSIRLSLSIWLSNSLDLPHHHHFASLSPSFSLLPYRGKRRALQCAIFA